MSRFANKTGMQPCREVYRASKTGVYGRKAIGGCFYIIWACWGPWFMYWPCTHTKNWKSGAGGAWLGTCILWHMAAFSAGNEHPLISSALSWLSTNCLSVVLCPGSLQAAKPCFTSISHFDPKIGSLATPPPRGTQHTFRWLKSKSLTSN